MKKIDLKKSSVFVVLLLCVTQAAVMNVYAQNGTKPKVKEPVVRKKEQPAPKSGSKLDDDFTQKTKPTEKTPVQPDVKNKDKTISDDIGDPLEGSGSKANPVPADTPATSTPATVPSPVAATSAHAPKKAGVMRLCLAIPRTQMKTSDTTQAAEAVSNTFKSYLAGPTIETVALTARLPSQAAEEAKQSGCDYVLYTSLIHKKGGSGSGLLGKVLGDAANSAVWNIPGGGSTAGAIARSTAISGVYTAASLAGSIKAKDELTLWYKMDAMDGTKPPMVRTEKAKAKSDGEDVLTPLIEKAAELIAAAIMKK